MHLKTSQIPAERAKRLQAQSGLCSLCQEVPAVPCLDHCHKNGHCRGVLCRGCNALLGKLENNRGRYGLGSDTKFSRFLSNVAGYLSRYRFGDVLHPTFKTPEQKRVARNAAARKRRADGQATK